MNQAMKNLEIIQKIKWAYAHTVKYYRLSIPPYGEIESKRKKKGGREKMDINTKVAKDLGRIPPRYLNQLDDTKTVNEKYQETRMQILELLTEEDDEVTEIIVTKG